MIVDVCERCGDIDNRSEGVVDVLGAMVQHFELSASPLVCGKASLVRRW